MNPITQAAAFLLDKRENQEVVENIPDSCYPPDPDTAHRVQDELVAMLTSSHNSAVCGYKLACTNKPIMELLGVDGPFSGQMMTHSMHPGGAVLDARNFVQRVVELEFIFVVGQDIPLNSNGYNAQSITPYIDSFAPGLEIVDHRFSSFSTVGGNALIADNAIHGACVMGRPSGEWREIDLSRHQVLLEVNGQIFSSGSGENVLSSPLNVMAWLANDLFSRGKTLKCGDIVTTGTACDVYHAKSGDKIRADFGKLGAVTLSFS